MLDKGAVESVDSTALAAYAVLGDQWVSFDNKESLGYKVAKARELSLGGVMVGLSWALVYIRTRVALGMRQCLCWDWLAAGGRWAQGG